MIAFIKGHISRTTYVITALLLAVPALSLSRTAHAAVMTTERLTLGTSAASEVTTHDLQFTIPTTGNVGSIEFEYCSNSPFNGTACVPTAGLSVLAASLDAETGETGFSIHPNTTANRLVLTRTPAAVTGPAFVTYDFSNITNPSTANSSSYVRISTYATDDGTGARTDTGALVFSTSGRIAVGGYVPPYLTFCVGITVANRCTSTTGNYIDLGELSSGVTRSATSQFAAATNDDTGYNVFVSGTTMTSGNNTITALNSPQSSVVGTNQFGLNLRANTTPALGSDVAGIGSAAPRPDYNGSDQFKFTSGDLIAQSTLPTDFNTFTVSYVVNVSDAQLAGVYTTTMTYIATASF